MNLSPRNGVISNQYKVPLFIMAARNNPLIAWTNCSFDTYNLLHRWFGRIVALEAITHTAAFAYQVGSFTAFTKSVDKAVYLQFGSLVSSCHLKV